MHSIRLDEVLFQGAVSLERTEAGIKPWRIPWTEASLFAPPLVEQAEMPAGVRLGFHSSTRHVQLKIAPFDGERFIDCVVDDELVQTIHIPAGSDQVTIGDLAAGKKKIELFLSQKAPVAVTGLAIDSGATRALLDKHRPRWITYGSSITQAKAAASPAETWPARVARRNGLDLTCLGYSAQCHIEPMVARMIRDLPADFISLCLGINVMGQASLGIRTFRQAVIGMVRIIRERHPNVPLVIQSPIFSPNRETTENAVKLTLVKMRSELQEAVALLSAAGDTNLHYLDGLTIFGPEHEAYLPDGLHPNADGYRIMADNFERRVLQAMGIGAMIAR